MSRVFGTMAALSGFNLRIQPGELLALLGPSGCGKTTALRLLAGFDQPTSGAVLIDHADVSRVPANKRDMGMVFQSYSLFPTMSAQDNVAFGLRLRGRSGPQRRTRAAELLDLVGLGEHVKKYPHQLSGGQQQRVALARALAVEPRVLLLDEPFGALDAKVRKDLRRWLRELHERTGHTTVFVTHDQEEALELADRVAILNAGKLEQVGTTDEVYDRPASPFVMSFVGDTSSIPVEFDGTQFLHEGQPFKANVEGSCQGRGRLYVRPRDIEIIQVEAGQLAGTVINVHRTAAGRRAQITIGTTDTVIEGEVEIAKTLRAGDRVGILILKGRVFPE